MTLQPVILPATVTILDKYRVWRETDEEEKDGHIMHGSNPEQAAHDFLEHFVVGHGPDTENEGMILAVRRLHDNTFARYRVVIDWTPNYTLETGA